MVYKTTVPLLSQCLDEARPVRDNRQMTTADTALNPEVFLTLRERELAGLRRVLEDSVLPERHYLLSLLSANTVPIRDVPLSSLADIRATVFSKFSR